MNEEKKDYQGYLDKSRKRNFSKKVTSGILSLCFAIIIILIIIIVFG